MKRSHRTKINPAAAHRLSIRGAILQYQRTFARQFLPKYVYSIARVVDTNDKTVVVIARVKPIYHSVKGKTEQFSIELSKVSQWHANAALYGFIGTSNASH